MSFGGGVVVEGVGGVVGQCQVGRSDGVLYSRANLCTTTGSSRSIENRTHHTTLTHARSVVGGIAGLCVNGKELQLLLSILSTY